MHVVFCPDKQPYSEPFMCLGLVLEHQHAAVILVSDFLFLHSTLLSSMTIILIKTTNLYWPAISGPFDAKHIVYSQSVSHHLMQSTFTLCTHNHHLMQCTLCTHNQVIFLNLDSLLVCFQRQRPYNMCNKSITMSQLNQTNTLKKTN